MTLTQRDQVPGQLFSLHLTYDLFQEKICEESSSFDLSSADIASAIRDLSDLGDKIAEYVRMEEHGAGDMSQSEAAMSKSPLTNEFSSIFVWTNLYPNIGVEFCNLARKPTQLQKFQRFCSHRLLVRSQSGHQS